MFYCQKYVNGEASIESAQLIPFSAYLVLLNGADSTLVAGTGVTQAFMSLAAYGLNAMDTMRDER